MKQLTALRDFRLVDRGSNLKSGDTIEVEDSYFNESRSLRAARNAGWIDLTDNVKKNDERLVPTVLVPSKRTRTIKTVLEDDGAQQTMQDKSEVASPGMKKAAEAQRANLERAENRMKRLRNGETPIDSGVNFKMDDTENEVVGSEEVSGILVARKALGIEREKQYRASMDERAKQLKQAAKPLKPAESKSADSVNVEKTSAPAETPTMPFEEKAPVEILKVEKTSTVPAVKTAEVEAPETEIPVRNPGKLESNPAPVRDQATIKEEVSARALRRKQKSEAKAKAESAAQGAA